MFRNAGADLDVCAKDAGFEWMKPTDTMKLFHAAAGCGHFEVVKYLAQYSDVTATDTNGWNGLHYCLKLSKNLEILQYLLDKGCDGFAVDVYGFSPLSLSIEKEPIFAKILLESKAVSKGMHTHFTLKEYEVFEFQYDGIEVSPNANEKKLLRFHRFSDLSQKVSSKFTWKEKTTIRANEINTPWYGIIELLIACERKDLLNLPIIQSLLDAKWQNFGKSNYLRSMLLYCLFLISFLFCSFQISLETIHTTLNELGEPDYLFLICVGILVLSVLRLWYMECRELLSNPGAYVTSLWNLFDMLGLVFMLPVLCLILQNAFGSDLAVVDALQRRVFTFCDAGSFAGISVFFLTLKFLQFAAIPKTTGPMIIITKGMMADISKFCALFLILYTAFVCCFYFLMRSPSNPIEVKSVAWMLLCWIIGMIEHEDLMEAEERVVIIHVFFVLYILVVVIMLLNLLIAMMSNTFQAVVENADLEWMFGYSKELMGIQSTLSESRIAKYVEYIREKQKQRQRMSSDILHHDTESQNWAGLLRDRLLSMENKLDSIENALSRQ